MNREIFLRVDSEPGEPNLLCLEYDWQGDDFFGEHRLGDPTRLWKFVLLWHACWGQHYRHGRQWLRKWTRVHG